MAVLLYIPVKGGYRMIIRKLKQEAADLNESRVESNLLTCKRDLPSQTFEATVWGIGAGLRSQSTLMQKLSEIDEEV